jgi:hypothetical protein
MREMKEEWKNIPGYEGLYQVSTFGNIKSLNYLNTGKERLLKKVINRSGYYYIGLSKNGNRKLFKVHQLVVMAFLDHKPDGTMNVVVNHIDNNPLNNNVANLELVTNRYNLTCHKTDPGLTLNNKTNKWGVRLKINNKTIYLGSFDDKNEAQNIYENAIKNADKFNGDNDDFRNLINPKSRKYEDRGVCFYRNKWCARFAINKIRINFYGINSKEEAKRIFDFAKTNKHIFDGDKKKFKEFCLLGKLSSSG